MIEAQKKVVGFCDVLLQEAQKCGCGTKMESAITELRKDAEEQQLAVPVIGAFSAGKSTLINNIIGRDVLPVAITPETSLAAELRFSPEEFIEAVTKEGAVERYELADINALKDKAADYAYARVYLNSPALTKIEPLILVDMPGFDSPLDSHEKAIMAYLERGCHYIVLSSVEEGTISKSLLRRLKFIDNFERGFSFFLSKADLRPPATVGELAAHYHKLIDDALNIDVPVVPLGEASGEEVVALLKKINACKLFFNMYRPALKNAACCVLEILNLRVKTAKISLEKNEALVREMEESIVKIQRKAEELIEEIKTRYSSSMVTNVVNHNLGGALDGAIGELVEIGVSGNGEEVTRRLNEIINDALLVAVKNKLNEIGVQIAQDFSVELGSLNTAMAQNAITPNFAENIAESVHSTFSNLQALGERMSGKNNLNKAYKIGTTVLAITTSIVAPILEIIIVFLPEILGPIIKHFQQQKQREVLRNKFLTEVFPNIKRRATAELSAQVDGQIKLMVEQTRDEYEQKIEAQREAVAANIEKEKSNAEAVQSELASLEESRNIVQTIANEIMEVRYE